MARLRPHEHEVCLGIAVFRNKAKFRLDIRDIPVFQVLRNNKAQERAADAVVINAGGFGIGDGRGEMKLCDLGCGHLGLLVDQAPVAISASAAKVASRKPGSTTARMGAVIEMRPVVGATISCNAPSIR